MKKDSNEPQHLQHVHSAHKQGRTVAEILDDLLILCIIAGALWFLIESNLAVEWLRELFK